MQNFNNLKIKQKIAAVTFVIIILITIFLTILYFYGQKIILKNTNSELNNTNRSIVNMVQTSTRTSVRSYLKAVAEENRFIIKNIYEDFKNGKYTEDEAINAVSQFILAEKIGKSGYVYIVNSNGVLLIHPYKELIDTDISQYEFTKKQMVGKTGYLEYDWQNPVDLNKREKALYMEYFEEWDMIISVTAYRDEFENLINTEDFKDEVLSVKFGENGYSYVITGNGIIKIHPVYKEGINWYDASDSRGNKFVQEMCSKKNGTLSYFWQNPDENIEREKLVVFQYIPELNWIVASGSYKNEFLKPLRDMQKIALIMLVVLVSLLIFQHFLLEKVVVKPLYQLISAIRLITEKKKHIKLKIINNDEIGELSNEFNILFDSVKNYENHLNEMVNSRTLELSLAYEELKQSNYQNEKNERFITTLFETIPYPIFYKNEYFRYIRCNSAFEKFIGKSKKEIYGKTVYDLSSEKFADIYHQKDLELFNNPPEQEYETIIINSSGESRDVIFKKVVCFVEDKKMGVLGLIQDITELKSMEKSLKDLAIKDILTNLYNKNGLKELGTFLFELSEKNKNKIAVFIIDIDNFSNYNNRYGYQSGDICLKKIGNAIKKCCQNPMDLVGRYGGEKFLIIMSDIDEKNAVEFGEKLQNSIRDLKIENLNNIAKKIVTVSIGAYIDIPEKSEDFDRFIEKAEMKLYIAKSKGKDTVEF